MLRTLGFSLTIFILFTGCSGGEKCCFEERAKTNLDTTSYETNSNNPTLIINTAAPEANIIAEKKFCKIGDMISFDGQASKSSIPQEKIVTYEWIMNDHLIGTDDNITIDCDTEGQKDICLQVTDNNKISNKKCLTYIVKEDKNTLPPVSVITVEQETANGFWFDCSKSYDQDQIDSDNNSSNDTQVVKATWNIYKTKNGERQPLHTRDICRKWVGVSDDLDLMEVTLIVTDDDNETASVTEVYTWDGQELIKEP